MKTTVKMLREIRRASGVTIIRTFTDKRVDARRVKTFLDSKDAKKLVKAYRAAGVECTVRFPRRDPGRPGSPDGWMWGVRFASVIVVVPEKGVCTPTTERARVFASLAAKAKKGGA